jgi:hypothetical protein
MFIPIIIVALFVVGLLVGLTLGLGIGMRVYEEHPYRSNYEADKTIHMETITIDNGKFYKKI